MTSDEARHHRYEPVYRLDQPRCQTRHAHGPGVDPLAQRRRADGTPRRRTRAAQRAVDQLSRAYQAGGRLAVALPGVFDEAGLVLRKLRARGTEVRRAALVNDALIAMTARRVGATVLTRDRDDYARIRDVRRFALDVVA